MRSACSSSEWPLKGAALGARLPYEGHRAAEVQAERALDLGVGDIKVRSQSVTREREDITTVLPAHGPRDSALRVRAVALQVDLESDLSRDHRSVLLHRQRHCPTGLGNIPHPGARAGDVGYVVSHGNPSDETEGHQDDTQSETAHVTPTP